MGKEFVKILCVIALFGGLIFLFYLHYLKGKYPNDYEGRVIDKWVNIAETQEGSRLSRRMLIETETGKRIEVPVNVDTYEQAKPGMRIESKLGKIELK